MNQTIEQRGFSLLEVLVSLSLFGVMLSSLPAVYVAYTKHNSNMQLKTEAMSAAQLAIEEIRELDPSTLPTTGSDSSVVTVNSHDFDVNTYYCEDSSLCITSNNRHITVRVGLRGSQMYEVQTVFTKLD